MCYSEVLTGCTQSLHAVVGLTGEFCFLALQV